MLEHSSRIMFPEAISILQWQTEDTLRNHGKQHLPNHPFRAYCIPRPSQSDQEKEREGKADILSSIRTNVVWREFKAGKKHFSAPVLRPPNHSFPQWTELTTDGTWKMLVELFIYFFVFLSAATRSAWLPRDLFCTVELGERSKKRRKRSFSENENHTKKEIIPQVNKYVELSQDYLTFFLSSHSFSVTYFKKKRPLQHEKVSYFFWKNVKSYFKSSDIRTF